MNKGVPKPMSIIEFADKSQTEEQCKEHLFRLCFPDGFVCRKCGNIHGIHVKTRQIMNCNQCGCPVSATSGTMMQKTKTEIRKWYYAIYLITSSKRVISSKELQRQKKSPTKTEDIRPVR